MTNEDGDVVEDGRVVVWPRVDSARLYVQQHFHGKAYKVMNHFENGLFVGYKVRVNLCSSNDD